MTSDFGRDTLDSADDIRFRDEEEAKKRSAKDPILYRIVYVMDGQEHYEAFRAHSTERASVMRSRFGIQGDNHAWAVQAWRAGDSRWGDPLGDAQLGAKLKKLGTYAVKER